MSIKEEITIQRKNITPIDHNPKFFPHDYGFFILYETGNCQIPKKHNIVSFLASSPSFFLINKFIIYYI